jgi:hypothetical protein
MKNSYESTISKKKINFISFILAVDFLFSVQPAATLDPDNFSYEIISISLRGVPDP